MILRSLELENFGKFRGVTFELRRGMNLVLGHNEAGKSTLAEVIPSVLFGTRHVEQYKPWGRNACAAKLFFEGKNRTVEIKRNMLTDEVHLVERDDMYHTLSEFSGRVPPRGRSAVYQKYYDLLEQLLGISDETLFRATCYFGHRPLEWSGDELSQKLRSLIGGGEEEGDYARIMDQLLDDYFHLSRVNPWGRDKQRNRELDDINERLAELDKDLKESAPESRPVDPDLAARIEKLTAEVTRDRDEYAKGVRYVEHIRSRLSVDQNVADPDNPAVAVKHMPDEGSQKKTGDNRLPEHLPPELPEILSQAADIRQELAQFQQPFAKLLQKERQVSTAPWGKIVSLSFVPILVGVFAWWQAFHFQIVAGLASLALVGLFTWGAWRQLQQRRALDACKKERKQLEQKKAQVLQRQAELSDRCEALGLPSSAIDLVRLQKTLDKQRVSSESGESHQEAEASQHQFEQESAKTKSPLPTERAELVELESRLAEFAAELERREQDLKALQEQAASNVSGFDQNDPRIEERQRLCKTRDDLERQRAVLQVAIELLAEAIEEFTQSDLSTLVEEVSRLFSKVTKGRYSRVRLNADMSPEIQVAERRWKSVDCFSRGTVDALYLVLRVALLKVRGDGRSLPLLLDDPFAHLDTRRLNAVLNVVDMASSDGQLILLSHNESLGRRAAKERWHVISLGEDSAEADQEEEQDHDGQMHLL